MVEAVENVVVEGVGLDAECERLVLATAVGESREKSLRRCLDGRRFSSAVPMLSMLVLCRKREALEM